MTDPTATADGQEELVGLLKDLFAANSASAYVDRAQRKMAAGKLDEATAIVARGLERFPGSPALTDLRLGLHRARAHPKIRAFEKRIAESGDPRAFEEIIELYEALKLPAEARRRALAYVERHPEHDSPHLILGRMHLEGFFDDLRASDGHKAHDHLVKAASLSAMAVQPRLLLAELYFCIGAHRSLSVMLHAIDQLTPGEESIAEARGAAEQLERDDESAEDSLDGLFVRIEVNGRLVNAPELWPLSKRKGSGPGVREQAADDATQRLVGSGALDEVVLLRRDGSVVSHATPTGLASTARPGAVEAHEALVKVARTVSTSVYPQAREFDMGRLERCTIAGAFGHVVVGQVGHVLAGARAPVSAEPHRMWQHMRMALKDLTEGNDS